VIYQFSHEQQQLRQTVRRFMDDTSSEREVRRLMATDQGYDQAVWNQMACELGLLALAIPEQYGGAGGTAVDLLVTLEEMGRSLFCGPYLSTAVSAVSLLLASGDPAAQARYLPEIANGSIVATVAIAEAPGRWDEAGVELRATRSAGGWHLHGQKSYVLDGHIADLILVAGRTPLGISLFAVDRDTRGLSTETLATMDLTRKQAKLTFSSTPCRLLGTEGGAWPAIARALDLTIVGQAAEQVGGAQRVLEMAVEFAKNRIQFGRPIGSFQAIQHKCVDMLIRLELARSAAYWATWAAAEARDDFALAVSVAKAHCSESFSFVASENIQIHGGIGFTWEHSAHLYFKRAKSSELLFGDQLYHRALIADLLAI